MKRGSINYSIIIIHKGELDLNSTDQRKRHRNVQENLGKEGRKADVENGLVDTRRGRESGTNVESSIKCKM